MSYTKAGLPTVYTPSSINGIVPYQLSSPLIINDSTTASLVNNAFIMRYATGVADADRKAFNLYTTCDIAQSTQNVLSNTLGTQVKEDHWESRCRLHAYLITMTEKTMSLYKSDPFKDVRYLSVYSERSSILIGPSQTQTISISNIGFSFLRYCLIYLYSTATAAGDINRNINSVESHWSAAPMSSSRCTISNIQATLSSVNLYSQVENSQYVNYKVLNSNSYESGQDISNTSGQITERMNNICPILLLDLSKHEPTLDPVQRTIQVRLKNLSTTTLAPYFYLYYAEGLKVNPFDGSVELLNI